MRIGFLGPYGTFSQQAARIHIEEQEAELVPFVNIAECILAAAEGKVDEAVVPVENSIEGPVNVTLDMMAWDVNLKINKEIIVPIEQHLMVKKQSGEITRILSHPQCFGQCATFIGKHYPSIPVEYTYSTAQAAQTVATSNENWAAIASKAAAQEYKLTILNEAIHDNKNNVTRFIVLSGQDGHNIFNNKTSIVFSTQNKPGSLYSILDILNVWDINMTRIESRPSKDSLGKYIFFVDLEGHREDEDLRDALTMIKRKASFFKMLGSYAVYS